MQWCLEISCVSTPNCRRILLLNHAFYHYALLLKTAVSCVAVGASAAIFRTVREQIGENFTVLVRFVESVFGNGISAVLVSHHLGETRLIF